MLSSRRSTATLRLRRYAMFSDIGLSLCERYCVDASLPPTCLDRIAYLDDLALASIRPD